MSTSARKLATWIATALFAVAIVGGEAWHLVPGNGHWIELPGGCLPWGIEVSADAPVGPPAAGEPNHASSLEDDFCLICQLAGQAFSHSAWIVFPLILPAQDDSLPRHEQLPSATVAAGLDIRGPPSI